MVCLILSLLCPSKCSKKFNEPFFCFVFLVLFVCLFVFCSFVFCSFVYLFVCLFVCSFVCLFVLFFCVFVCLFVLFVLFCFVLYLAGYDFNNNVGNHVYIGGQFEYTLSMCTSGIVGISQFEPSTGFQYTIAGDWVNAQWGVDGQGRMFATLPGGDYCSAISGDRVVCLASR